MREHFEASLDTAGAVIRESLVGTAIIVVVAGAGWVWAADRGRLPVRVVAWWVDHVVQPLVRLRTWAARAVVIALNNSIACGLMMLLGVVPLLGWVGVVCIGLTLGIAIRRMTTLEMPMSADHGSVASDGDASDNEGSARRAWRRVAITVGLALNALELPAIMLSAGLALGQGAMSEALSRTEAVQTYLVLIVPTLFVAAAGESLWMGATRGFERGPRATVE